MERRQRTFGSPREPAIQALLVSFLVPVDGEIGAEFH
jgi:hypothetical protein